MTRYESLIKNNNCEKCGLNSKDNKSNYMPMTSRTDKPKFLIVGEAPGATEDENNEQFIGRSGQVLRTCIEEVIANAFPDKGITPDDFAYTNCVRCRPPENKTPTTPQRNACKPSLEADILQADPKMIFAIGATSIKAVTDKTVTMASAHGKISQIYLEDKGRVKAYHVTNCYHPAAVLRNICDMSDLMNDLYEGLAAYFKKEEVVYPDYELIKTKSQLETLIERAKTEKYLSFDIETNGLNPFLIDKPIISMIQIAFKKNEAFVIPIDHFQSPWKTSRYINNSDDYIIDRLKELLSNDSIKIAANGIFDTKWLKAIYGIEVNNYILDALYMYYVLDERNRMTGLKYLANKLSNIPYYESGLDKYLEEHNLGKQDSAIIPLKDIIRYAGGDVDAALQVTLSLLERLKKEKQLHTFYFEFYSKLYPLIMDMEIEGLPADADYIDEITSRYKREVIAVELALRSLPIVRKFEQDRKDKGEKAYRINFNSYRQLQDILYMEEYINHKRVPKEFLSTTLKKKLLRRDAHQDEYELLLLDRKNLSTSLPALSFLSQRGCSFSRKLWLFKKKKTLISKVFKSLPKYIDKNGRMHTSYKINWTVTGRLSSADPNLQNIPKKKEIKNIFAAPEGQQIIQIDLSQNELRFAGILSGDEGLYDTYLSGGDLHQRTANLVFHYNKSKEEQTAEERTIAKNINFGLIYSRGARSVAKGLNDAYWESMIEDIEDGIITQKEATKKFKSNYVTQEMATEWIDSFYQGHPELKQWQEIQRAKVDAGEPVVSLYGRKRHTDKMTEAVNAPIQGSGADYCLAATIGIHSYLKKYRPEAKIINSVHDSVMILVPDEYVEEVVYIGLYFMENTPLPYWGLENILYKREELLPIKADAEVGKRWGELKEFEVNEEKYAEISTRIQSKLALT